MFARFTGALEAGLAAGFEVLFLEEALEEGFALGDLAFAGFFAGCLPLEVWLPFFEADFTLVVDLVLAGCLTTFLTAAFTVLDLEMGRLAVEAAGFLAAEVAFFAPDDFREVAGLEVLALRTVFAGVLAAGFLDLAEVFLLGAGFLEAALGLEVLALRTGALEPFLDAALEGLGEAFEALLFPGRPLSRTLP